MAGLTRMGIFNSIFIYVEKSNAMINREKVIDVFEKYVCNYDLNLNMIRLKAEHTYRVAQLCDQIARSIDLPDEDVDLVWLMGMLHDLGRFEQWTRFKTFQDGSSIDHAKLSASLLFEDGLIRDYIEEATYDSLIELVVKTHSAYRLPEELSERELMFCNIVRDADKIDILKVNIDFSMEEIYSCTSEDLQNSAITKEVLDCVEQRTAVLRTLKKTTVDNVVGHICLAFELVYPYSRQTLVQQGYIDRFLSFQSKNEKTRQDFIYINECMKKFLAE